MNIDLTHLPLHSETLKLAEQIGIPAVDLALWGGEDYQLLLAIPPRYRELFPQWIAIGEFNSSGKFTCSVHGQITEINEFKGWSHFKD
ncbi:thiamine monophosphate kinase [compost metagenome]